MTTQVSAKRIPPPKQARSRDTLDRILAAARQVLEAKNFEEATLSEVVERAGVTVGAFYHRFPGKDALLEYLEQEAYRSMRSAMASVFAAPKADAVTVAELLRGFTGAQARMYRENRGALRAILLKSRSDPERQARRMEFTREALGTAVEWMLSHPGEVEHPDPATALQVALLFVSSALRDVILYDERWVTAGSDAISDERLVEELTRAALAYAGLREG
jgi:AcrR family transcriptional regulator